MATLAQIDLTQEMSLVGTHLPATLRPSPPLSDDELIAFSRLNKPFRIERNAAGDLEIMSPLGFEGGQRELFAMRVLGNWAEEHGGVCVSSQAGFKLPDSSVRCPDASWASNVRVNSLSQAQRRGFAPFCPDFLIEILSESDSRLTLESKMSMWIANGTQLAWMIDPFAAELLIYRPNLPVELLAHPDWVEADTVVPGFRLQTSRLWAS